MSEAPKKRPSACLTFGEKDTARAEFKKADLDHSGRVELKELRAWVLKRHPILTGTLFEPIVKKMMAQDTNGDGLDVEEFLDAYATLLIEAGLKQAK